MEIQTERDVWDLLRGPQNRNERRCAWRRFHKLFEDGHDTSIRDLVEYILYAKENGRLVREIRQFIGLRNIHPTASRLLLKYGIDYKPKVWHTPPDFGEPTRAACFANAWELMHFHNSYLEQTRKYRDLTNVPEALYVEGIAFGPLVPPMLHAWNSTSTKDTTAVDWTFYASAKWTRYLGISLTQAEYDVAAKLIFPKKPKIHLLLRSRNFCKIEAYMEDLLAKRAEEQTSI